MTNRLENIVFDIHAIKVGFCLTFAARKFVIIWKLFI